MTARCPGWGGKGDDLDDQFLRKSWGKVNL